MTADLAELTATLRALMDDAHLPWWIYGTQEGEDPDWDYPGIESGAPLGDGTIVCIGDRDDAECTGVRGDAPETRQKRAALIVAAVNALPRLLAAAEDAERLRKALEPFANIGVGTNPDYAPTVRLRRDVILDARAALAPAATEPPVKDWTT